MSYAICIVPVAHVRLGPDHRAEMVSQFLFGESLKVISVNREGWMETESMADRRLGRGNIIEWSKNNVALWQ